MSEKIINDDLTTIGEKVHAMRVRRGLTLAQLSEMTRVTAVTIHNLERGVYEPKISTLIDLCKALEVPIEFFLCEQDEGLFQHIPSGFDPEKENPQFHAWRVLPMVNRIELAKDEILLIPDSHGLQIILHLISGKVFVKSGQNSAELLPGDALHLELFRATNITTLEKSQLLKISCPDCPAQQFHNDV